MTIARIQIQLRHGIKCMTVDDFLKDVFYRAYWIGKRSIEPLLVIGHNLPFDLAALAKKSGLAKGENYGGFSLVLYEHIINQETEGAAEVPAQIFGEAARQAVRQAKTYEYPRIVIKKLGASKHLMKAYKDRDLGPKLYFLDTMTLARALIGPGGLSIKALLRRLSLPPSLQKGEAQYDGPIIPEYIHYCVSEHMGNCQGPLC